MSIKNHYLLKTALVIWLSISLLSLVGCSSEDSELGRYINTIKTRPPKPIEPIPEFPPLPKFTFPEKDNRRSPFKPVVEQEQDNNKYAPNDKRPKQPLEAFPLDALSFVGILKEGPIVWGLISQPGGLVTRVKAGDYMGQNYGQILSITNNTMQLEETVQLAGKWEKKRIKLDMRVGNTKK